jgi:hypothetical protein
MECEAMPTVVEQRDPPEALRTVSGLPRPDYADCFTAIAPGATGRTPEGWARTAIERASKWGRFLTWQVLCGLRLERRPSPDHLGGWRIAERGENWIRLAARSWFMTARIVVHVDDGRVSFATFVRYDTPVAALVWPQICRIHRRAVPSLLRSAVAFTERARDHG